MKRVALTFIGKDRPGIIAAITQALFKSGCNIEDTTMTVLEGEFAMILIALLPDQKAEKKLKLAYDSLQKKWGLNHFWKALSGALVRGEKHPKGTQTYILSVIGKDRTGIVYHTSRILAEYHLNITDLNSKILGRPGSEIFTMILEVDLPARFKVRRLDPAWHNLKRKLHVDVQFRPLEKLSL